MLVQLRVCNRTHSTSLILTPIKFFLLNLLNKTVVPYIYFCIRRAFECRQHLVSVFCSLMYCYDILRAQASLSVQNIVRHSVKLLHILRHIQLIISPFSFKEFIMASSLHDAALINIHDSVSIFNSGKSVCYNK